MKSYRHCDIGGGCRYFEFSEEDVARRPIKFIEVCKAVNGKQRSIFSNNNFAWMKETR